MQLRRKRIAILVCLCLVAAAAWGQFRGRRQRQPVFERGNVPQPRLVD